MKLLIILLFIWNIGLSNDDSSKKPLDGWTIHSADDSFLKELKDKGVRDRRDVIQEIKESGDKTYSYDICLNYIKSTIPSFAGSDEKDIQQICHDSINIVDYLFFAIYRKSIEDDLLKKFREKMVSHYLK